MPSIYAGLRELPSSFSLHCLQLLDPPPFPVRFTLPVPIPTFILLSASQAQGLSRSVLVLVLLSSSLDTPCSLRSLGATR
jgi:hypothetical protein